MASEMPSFHTCTHHEEDSSKMCEEPIDDRREGSENHTKEGGERKEETKADEEERDDRENEVEEKEKEEENKKEKEEEAVCCEEEEEEESGEEKISEEEYEVLDASLPLSHTPSHQSVSSILSPSITLHLLSLSLVFFLTDSQRRVSEANELKVKGNHNFGNGEYSLAQCCYQNGFSLFFSSFLSSPLISSQHWLSFPPITQNPLCCIVI